MAYLDMLRRVFDTIKLYPRDADLKEKHSSRIHQLAEILSR